MEIYYEIKDYEPAENTAQTILSVVEKISSNRDKHKEILSEILIQTIEAIESLSLEDELEKEF